MTNKTYHFNIGVDIAKQKFDVSFNDQRVVSFENSVAGFKLLLKEIKDKTQTRVVMEATGGSPAGEGFIPLTSTALNCVVSCLLKKLDISRLELPQSFQGYSRAPYAGQG